MLYIVKQKHFVTVKLTLSQNTNCSNSTDNIHLPIAIPTLPNMSDKTDTLWPFPFPPVEQTPQTHLLYEGKFFNLKYSKPVIANLKGQRKKFVRRKLHYVYPIKFSLCSSCRRIIYITSQ